MNKTVVVQAVLAALGSALIGCTTEKTSSREAIDIAPHEDGLSNVAFVGNITQSGTFSSQDFGTDGYWNQLTPENESKWSEIAPTQGSRNWSTLDSYYQTTRRLGIPMKGHTLCWGQQEPDWVSGLSPSAKVDAVRQWIQSYCERYPDLELLDVVNEADHHPPSYASALNAEFRSHHEGYDDDPHAWVLQCFEWANQYCGNTKLLYNDFNALSYETDNIAAIAQKIDALGWLDGIGAQAHALEWDCLDHTAAAPYPWNTGVLRSHLDQLAAISDIYISEWEVRETVGDNNADQNPVLPNYTAEYSLKTQLPIFYHHPAVKGITFWGYKEGQMWQPTAALADADGNLNAKGRWIQAYLQNPFECGDGRCEPMENAPLTKTPGGFGKVCEADCRVIVPARIEAEDYLGAYESTTGSNSGGACDRNDGVDMETTGDSAGGNCNVGWTTAGEWLAYTFDAQDGGIFDLYARVASAYSGKTFRFEVDGVNVSGPLSAPSNGWQTYADVGVEDVAIASGMHTLRVVFITGDTNLNWIDILGEPEPTCSDGVQNQDETGVDCGGACPLSCDLAPCIANTDCASRVCDDGVCEPPSCSDGVMNGEETGVDCGGDCAACVNANIPGRIQAEDYIAYNDTNSVNEGAADYPSCDNGDGVDQGISGDTDGTCSVGWTANGEWLEYELVADTATVHDIVARAGSGTTGGAFRVEIDGVAVSGNVSTNNIGWDRYEDYTAATDVPVSPGVHTMRVVFLGAMNLNWIEFRDTGMCNQTTCDAAGAECGTISDDCGGSLDCGACADGEVCSQNICACVPTTCAAEDAFCGILGDGCGGTINCGVCAAGERCSAAYICECAPTTCAAENASCGSIDDGCGATLDCGSCADGERCTENVCECVPTSCAAENAVCGMIDSGCGTALDCGDCAEGERCNAAHTCECAPTTCATQGAVCGAIDDGCGNTLDCGSCADGEQCNGNICACVPTRSCESEEATCGTIEDGCGTTLECGDCADGEQCNGAHTCELVPTCDDRVQNGDETDIDCGGSCPTACDDFEGCLANTDCQSGVCLNTVCEPPSCFDGIMNGEETGVDCGGDCATCVNANIPGRIQAEDYIAYNDTNSVNEGAADYPSCDRGDGVDQGVSGDTDGTCSVGWTANGEWLEYELVAGTATVHDIVARAGSGTTGGAFRVEIDGVAVSGSVSTNNIGWDRYEDYTAATDVAVSPGVHTMRVVFLGAMNLNWIEFRDTGMCNQTTCDAAGAECGTISDDCGGSLDCGACADGEVCSQNICACVPTRSCESEGAVCGTIDDGCGTPLDCGDCAEGERCTAAHACECAPTTCDAEGAGCGTIDDGCGGSLDCGSCADGEQCNGNVCQCMPTSCEAEGATCGTIDDGCGGGTLECGDCADGEQCSDAHTCEVIPTCDDLIRNGDETDIDCGGSCPSSCDDFAWCLVNADCTSGVCRDTICIPPACDDGVMNGDEIGVDCGGSCASCVNANVPGRIEAEGYSDYNDTDGVNEGASDYPACDHGDGVDLGESGDTDGTCSVGWTTNGEWLAFELTVAADATFDLAARAGSGTTGGAFRVEIDGIDISGTIRTNNIGWTSYESYPVATNVSLTAGAHTMRVVFLGSMNLNWIEIEEAGVCAPTTCEDAGAECGTISDNCGGMLACGACSEGATCSASNQCETSLSGCTCPQGCGSVVTQTAPFTMDGQDDTCYFFDASMGRYVNSWNTEQVNINGQDYTNVYVGSNQYPARIDGGYYLYVASSVSWGHVEVRN